MMRRRGFITGAAAALAYSSIRRASARGGIRRVLLGAGSNYPSLLDRFGRAGSNLNLNGQTPDIGSPWITSLASGGTIVTNNGTMSQSGGTGSGYAENNTPSVIGEIGCAFSVSQVTNSIVLGGSAPGASGHFLIAEVTPSGNFSSFTPINVFYTILSTDTLANIATGIVAQINATTSLTSLGISASANGQTVTLTASNCPKFGLGSDFGGISVADSVSEVPTLAIYPTGTNPTTNGCDHFVLGPDGTFFWGNFVSGSVTPYLNFNAFQVGLAASTSYTYRVCIQPPYVWGGLWITGGALLGAAVVNDPATATFLGNSCFFETSGAGAGGPGILQYSKCWTYPKPTVQLAAIQAAA